MRPNIPDQIAELAARGVTRIMLMPYFLFQGKHVDIDIPNILADCHEWFPAVTLELLPTLENDPAVEDAVVQRLVPLVAAECAAARLGGACKSQMPNSKYETNAK